MHFVDEILVKLETADNNLKNRLENELVEQGSAVVPTLVSKLQTIKNIFKCPIIKLISNLNFL